MALDIFKFFKGIRIKNASTPTKELELAVNDSATAATKTTLQASQSADRTVTLPDATDTIVARATTDTLTNKTLSGNTASNLVNGSGTINFNSTGTITVPNATDTLVGKATTDTLSNKTLDNTTVINVSDSNFLVQDNGNATKQARLEVSGVTAGQTRVLTVPDANLTIVGTDTTQTLTNKTLSGNTATSLVSGSGTFTFNTTGTITAPNATDTLVGKATTDTLTNKTIDADGTGNNITNIDDANIKAGAAIDASKIGDGTVSNAEFKFLDGVSSDIQTQINGKQSLSTLTTKGDIYAATASATTTRLAVGTNDFVLTADSAQTTGLKWAAVPSAATSSQDLYNLGLLISTAGNAVTFALKQADASTDPASGSGAVKIGFRSSTATSGLYNQRSVTGALSMTVSSGSTLGQLSGFQAFIYVYAIDNAGTVELAVSGTRFSDNYRVSTTAEGGAGASDSITGLYSTTARTNVPVKLIAIWEQSQTTAGTWTSTGVNLSLQDKRPDRVPTIIYNGTPTIAGGTIDGTARIATFPTRMNEIEGLYSGGQFTAPKSGFYFVSATAVLGGTIVVSSSLGSIQIAVNGTATVGSNSYAKTTTEIEMNASGIVFASAGQTIDVRVSESGITSPVFNGTFRNYLSISLIGV